MKQICSSVMSEGGMSRLRLSMWREHHHHHLQQHRHRGKLLSDRVHQACIDRSWLRGDSESNSVSADNVASKPTRLR
jgi:hypothetical protein